MIVIDPQAEVQVCYLKLVVLCVLIYGQQWQDRKVPCSCKHDELLGHIRVWAAGI